MHDWALSSISVDWEAGTATISLSWASRPAAIVAHGIRDLRIPRKFEWGPSVSVNRTRGPDPVEDGLLSFSIEMQSGDTIEIIATRFDLPASRAQN